MAVHTSSPSHASSSLTPSEKDFFSSSDDEQYTTSKSVPQGQTLEEESHDESGAQSNNDEEEEFKSHDDSSAKETPPTDIEHSLLNLIVPDSLSESREFSDSQSESTDLEEHPKLVTPISLKPPMAQGVKNPNIGKSKGKSPFNRIWPLEDEIIILKGMVRYKSQNDLNDLKSRAFHDFVKKEIKKDLTLQVSDIKLFNKIRKLKRKYFDVADHVKCGGKTLVSHDKIIYELGKKIWTDSNDENKMRAKGARAKYNNCHESLKTNLFFIKVVAAKRMRIRFMEEQLATISSEMAEFLVRRYREQILLKMKNQEQEMELQMETFKLIREGIERATR